VSDSEFRIEKDSLGEVKVPAGALFGAQTQRAVDNFPISGTPLPRAFLSALGLIKAAAAEANRSLGLRDGKAAEAIAAAAMEVEEGRHDAHFPIDVFQTGSGTSTNMNANEVIARLASRKSGEAVHPNDHVNLGQSSNDVIPTAIHVSACREISGNLLPGLKHLAEALDRRSRELDGVVKTGRTHLMDAMPVRLGQEISAWRDQVRDGIERIEGAMGRLRRLALGGTAVGTGVNAHPDFAGAVAGILRDKTGVPFEPSKNFFLSLSSQDAAVEASGQLRGVAVSLMKICNDLRWMNSGPLAGLGEISLPALQPGSSIMPGKVNPVIPEAVAMACAQVMGNDAAVAIAGQSGNFQLNVMLPLIALNLLASIRLLAASARLLADKAIAGFRVNQDRIEDALSRNPILVTALNPVIGYEKGAEIAKRAYAEGRPILEAAKEMTDLSEAELRERLDPGRLTGRGPGA